VGAGLAQLIQSLGPDVVATVQTQLSSLILVTFRWLTLSSGLFQLLVRMQGAISFTQIASRSAARMFLFQLLLVLLGSIVTKSLFNTVQGILDGGLTKIPTFLASSVPPLSTFFLNYVLNSILVTSVLEVMQLLPLLAWGMTAAAALACNTARSTWRCLCGVPASTAAREDPCNPLGSGAASASCCCGGGADAADDEDGAAYVSHEAIYNAGGLERGGSGAAVDRQGNVSQGARIAGGDEQRGVGRDAEGGESGGGGGAYGGGGELDGARGQGAYSEGARSQYVLEIYAKMVLMGSIFHVFMVSGHTGWGEGRSVAMLARARALLLPPPWISRVPSR
jgi:uncharacterized membrane protein YgcG